MFPERSARKPVISAHMFRNASDTYTHTEIDTRTQPHTHPHPQIYTHTETHTTIDDRRIGMTEGH